MASGTLTPSLLSESTSGQAITLDQTGAKLLHTAVSGTDYLDFVSLYVANNHTGTVEVTIEFGSTDIVVNVGAKRGLVVICDRMPANGGITINGYAATLNVIEVFGQVATAEL